MLARIPRLVGWTLLAVLAAAAATAAQRSAPSAEEELQIMRFEPLIVPLYGGGERIGLLGVQVSLTTDSRRERRRLEPLRPRLTDAWLHAASEHGRLYVSPHEAMDVAALHQALTGASRHLLGADAKIRIVEVMAYPG